MLVRMLALIMFLSIAGQNVMAQINIKRLANTTNPAISTAVTATWAGGSPNNSSNTGDVGLIEAFLDFGDGFVVPEILVISKGYCAPAVNATAPAAEVYTMGIHYVYGAAPKTPPTTELATTQNTGSNVAINVAADGSNGNFDSAFILQSFGFQSAQNSTLGTVTISLTSGASWLSASYAAGWWTVWGEMSNSGSTVDVYAQYPGIDGLADIFNSREAVLANQSIPMAAYSNDGGSSATTFANPKGDYTFFYYGEVVAEVN